MSAKTQPPHYVTFRADTVETAVSFAEMWIEKHAPGASIAMTTEEIDIISGAPKGVSTAYVLVAAPKDT